MFVIVSFFVGVIGDLILEYINIYVYDIANLKSYFEQHGYFESMMIAGGVMFLFGFIAELTIELTYVNLFIYGFLLDVMFRQFKLFPTLNQSFYTANNQLVSGLWGAILFPFVKFVIDTKFFYTLVPSYIRRKINADVSPFEYESYKTSPTLPSSRQQILEPV